LALRTLRLCEDTARGAKTGSGANADEATLG